MHTTIKTLFSKGYNKSDIAKMLDIDRKTVRKILKELDEKGYVERKERVSILDPHKKYISIQASKGLSAQRIYQDLKSETDYSGSYDTVKRYIAKIKITSPKVYMVLNSLPGEEAQVDFGYIGYLKLNNNKQKKAWIFVMELSYSRYMYAEIVLDQSVETFLNCHKNAFKYFGGVPQTVKIDNLKAAILETNFYEPVVQRNYAAFSKYYGFLPEPCRVRTPTDKGKVEANIKYVKNNCFKERNFENIEQAKAFLNRWLSEIANVRIHGTTKKVPQEIFKTMEQKELLDLPAEEYVITDISTATVMPNCHLSYKNNYYSAPFEYIGEEVDVIASNNLVKIFFKQKEIALHPMVRDEKGVHQTDKNHYPKNKVITTDEIKSRYKNEMAQIGGHALKFFELFLENAGSKYNYRAIAGILSLRKKYSDKIIDNACHRAYAYEALNYSTVKKICEKNLNSLPVENSKDSYLESEKTDIARDLSQYTSLLKRGEVM